MRQSLPLLLLLAAYLAAGAHFATRTPAWQAPDEPAHYNYVRQLSEGHWPVIEPQDYDEAYRSEIVSARFAPPYSIEPLTYEDWQPPLYYLLQTPLFSLTNGALVPLRLLNLLIGAATIAITYAIARLLWPQRLWLALLVAAFVALLPQHLALLASLNNDSLAELLIAAILWLAICQVQAEEEPAPGKSRVWLYLGLLLGLGFLTKATVYIMAPVLALALLWLYRRQANELVRNATLVFVPALAIGLPWWLRNLLVYPGFDPLATAAHDSVVVGQVRTAEWLATYGAVGTAQRFLQTTFQSFWGQFGWMGVVMDRRIYLLLLLFSLFVLAGFLWTVGKWFSRSSAETHSISRGSALLLAATFLFSLLVYLAYNVTFVQQQGRYLFPALIPIAVAVAVGIKTWLQPLLNRLSISGLLCAAIFALGLLALDLFALYNFIIPQLTTP